MALWAVAILIVVFVAIFLAFIAKVYCNFPIELHTSQVIVLGIIGAIPSLLIINFMRLVSRPTLERGDFDRNPWVALIREIAQSVVDAIKK